MNKKNRGERETSWEGVAKWYDSYLSDHANYFHKEIIFPGLTPLLKLKPEHNLLDIACGQGALRAIVPKGCAYVGLDKSKKLIDIAGSKGKTSASFTCAMPPSHSIWKRAISATRPSSLPYKILPIH